MSKSVEEIKKDLQEFFSDTERTPGETLDGLEEIQSEVEVMIESLESDGVVSDTTDTEDEAE